MSKNFKNSNFCRRLILQMYTTPSTKLSNITVLKVFFKQFEVEKFFFAAMSFIFLTSLEIVVLKSKIQDIFKICIFQTILIFFFK